MLVTTVGAEREEKLSPWKGLRLLSICSSLDPSGTELNAIRSAELLSSLGVSIVVLNVGRDGLLSQRYERIAEVHHEPMVRFGSSHHLKAISYLKSLLTRFKPDVVHAQDAYTVGLLGVFPHRLRARTVANRRWLRTGRGGLDALNALSYRRFDAITVNSRNVGALIADGSSGIARKVFYTPNFLASESFGVPGPEGALAWRQSMGISPDAVIVCCVARLSQLKRHDVLIDALAVLMRRCQLDVHLLIVGDGAESPILRERVSRLGLTSRTHFLGHVANPSHILHAADIAVLCSDREGMPNSLIEAAAVGLPIIATDVGGIPEIVEHGRTGLLFPVGSVAECAAALDQMTRDVTSRMQMGREARDLAVRKHSENAYLVALAAAYGLDSASGRDVTHDS